MDGWQILILNLDLFSHDGKDFSRASLACTQLLSDYTDRLGSPYKL